MRISLIGDCCCHGNRSARRIHLIPLRRFLEAVLQADLRDFFAETCFEVSSIALFVGLSQSYVCHLLYEHCWGRISHRPCYCEYWVWIPLQLTMPGCSHTFNPCGIFAAIWLVHFTIISSLHSPAWNPACYTIASFIAECSTRPQCNDVKSILQRALGTGGLYEAYVS